MNPIKFKTKNKQIGVTILIPNIRIIKCTALTDPTVSGVRGLSIDLSTVFDWVEVVRSHNGLGLMGDPIVEHTIVIQVLGFGVSLTIDGQ